MLCSGHYGCSAARFDVGATSPAVEWLAARRGHRSADAGITLFLYRIALRHGQSNRGAALVGLSYGLNPVSILISG